MSDLPIPADDFESVLEDYPIKLEHFEGPLDLLLHLIRKNEVDIYDIPILPITRQYLEYLDLMQELDLDAAGEFLVMAATLIHIKARMLVPRLEQETEEEADTEDPRDVLVRRLIEHQKYKAAAELLHDRETVRSAQWGRPDERITGIAGAPFERELEVDLFGLLQAFEAVLKRARERLGVEVPGEEVSIETRTRQIMERLAETEACGFDDLFDGAHSRGDLITTFLALLEMIRLKLIRVFQSDTLGPIRVYVCGRPQSTPPTKEAGDRRQEKAGRTHLSLIDPTRGRA
ncbi:MAG: segregation/condensation protein A [Acidobacteriota bacterium]|nr:segregation/condensation protein A [Acidobacteriota bacterium]